MMINKILKESKHGLTLFNDDEISWLEDRIYTKEIKSGTRYYVKCIIRNKEIVLKPEEIVRQLYTYRLINEYKYPEKRIRFEYPVNFGRQVKKADIVIFDKDSPNTEYIIVEVKKPNLKDGKNQLSSYCHATGCPIGVWINGGQTSQFRRIDPNFFQDITDIPKADETLEDVIKQRFTLRDLMMNDRLIEDNIDLKSIIKQLEDDVLANAGVDVFEEVFKLIFTKLFDEYKSREDKQYIIRQLKKKLSYEERGRHKIIKTALESFDNEDYRPMEFRNTGQTESELRRKIQSLFDEAKEKWKGVFLHETKIELTPSHLGICVSALQDVKLFNSNLQIIDEAFEYLVNKSSKGEKGQYFTPRHVIDMCVKMLNPQAGEYMIDPASGSCGFPVHTIFHITGKLFTNEDISEEEKQNILKIFGIDFDERAVRVSRTLNLIAGDGETNVLHMNALDYDRWDENYLKNRSWYSTYGKGFERLEKLRSNKGYGHFEFDILMANPPFAGDIKESRLIHKYELSFNSNNKVANKVVRDILFIERCLNMLKDGGRMAIVLPQGRFNNASDKRIREYISERARILAVIGLHGNTFKPHTGTKTSVLFVQKWHDTLCPKKEDYPIFFAVSENGGKDNSGKYIYVKNDEDIEILDRNGHKIVYHDLHNHNGERPDGIAEAFKEFAKAEGFSFVEG